MFKRKKQVQFSELIPSTDEESSPLNSQKYGKGNEPNSPEIEKSISKKSKKMSKKNGKVKKSKKDKKAKKVKKVKKVKSSKAKKKSKKNKKSMNPPSSSEEELPGIITYLKQKTSKKIGKKSSKKSSSENPIPQKIKNSSYVEDENSPNMALEINSSESESQSSNSSKKLKIPGKKKLKSLAKKLIEKAVVSSESEDMEEEEEMEVEKEVVLLNTRKWEDNKDPQKSLKKGAFQPEETETLMRALCQYCKENSLEEKDLLNLVSQKNEQHKGAWSYIASVLPNRSVQSCHNHCRRKFNPFNYKGKWEEDEVELLINYVKKYGREWEKIGQMIGRTGLNVRDKYKEIGGKNSKFRKKEKWTVEETIKLIKLVENLTNVKILRNSIKDLDYQTFDATYKPQRISKTNIKFQPDAIMTLLSPYINFSTAQSIDYKNIKWTQIAEELKTKSKDDCRNRFYLQVKNTIFQKSYFDEKLEDKLLKFVEESGAEYEQDINFGEFWGWLKENGSYKKFSKISAKEARVHWSKMKRIVLGRQGVIDELDELIFKLKKYYSEVSQGKRIKTVSSSSGKFSGNKLVDLWRREYVGDIN